MKNLRTTWLAFGCFLTGYNWMILRASSELSMKRVIKYTSALLVICLLWAFVGYTFTDRYLRGNWLACIVAVILMVFVVIQIERQIILSSKENKVLRWFRFIIGIAMALIGTVIIDQIIFKEDIAKKKLTTMDEEVKKIFPGRAEELKKQIAEIISIIEAKELERKGITDDIGNNPYVKVYDRVVQRDTAKNESVTITRRNLPNPKFQLLDPLDKAIVGLRTEKAKKDSTLLGLRPVIEAELKQNVGFLDELEVMYSLLTESMLSLCAWLIWFVFLLGLELLILASKIGETETDYDRMMTQQMNLHFAKIALLGRRSEAG